MQGTDRMKLGYSLSQSVSVYQHRSQRWQGRRSRLSGRDAGRFVGLRQVATDRPTVSFVISRQRTRGLRCRRGKRAVHGRSMMSLRGLAEESGVHARTNRAEAQEMDTEKRHQRPPERPLSFSRSAPSAHHRCLSFAFLESNPCAN